uniref:imelysin family protein n=1 Tax=Rhizobium sp. CFBP 8762 TaxID=2775279 RepID=UPI001FD4F504|nr:imelysin family protein [Rhizobium sp. CFBP 8762]
MLLRVCFAVAIPALLAFATPALALNEAAVPAVLQKAVDDVIRPGYRDLAKATSTLGQATAALCATPSQATRADTETAFNAVVRQWSMIEIVRVGPVIDGNRYERFLFFPDRKGLGLRQVQAVLAKADETATTLTGLQGKSVAVQGLTALEFVLYGTGSDTLLKEADSYRCRYGLAITQNLQAIATELREEWERPGGVQDAWKHPGPDNPVYRTHQEAMTGLLGILVHAVEATKDQRMQPFYHGTVDEKADAGKPKSAIYWRSNNTVASITANFEGLQKLWNGADMGSMLDSDSQSVADSINFVFTSLIRVGSAIKDPIESVLATEDGRGKLDFLLLNTRDVLTRLNEDYGKAIGLGAGFSFSDGD